LLKEEAIGAFILGTTSKVRTFSKQELELCHALSCQSALAISNAQLYEQAQQALIDLKQAYHATLEGWSLALEMRDHDTDKHTHRVTELTITLAKRMGISELELEDIRRGALLHDIGKMGIPDTILSKPTALSESEWEIMKTHPELAYHFLSQIEYLNTALDIPYCHHEKWDGSGYPRQLKGEMIPLPARIFAVVDVFDALTSDRPYRDAWTKKAAIKYIKEQSGKHFAPDVVGVFIDVVGDQ
jgi:putative nucleotidyltransferase with HDIG domain